MDIGKYGQRLAQMGLEVRGHLGNLESDRRRRQALINQEQEALSGQAWGALAGSAVGAAAGVYDERKRKFDKEHPGQDYSALDDIAQLFEDWV